MKIAVVGMSHIVCMERAYKSFQGNCSFDFINLREKKFLKQGADKASAKIADYDTEAIETCMQELNTEYSLFVLCLNGNEHVISSLVNNWGSDEAEIYRRIEEKVGNFREWLSVVTRGIAKPLVILPPPPPIASEDHLVRNAGIFAEKIARHGVSPAGIRLKAWQHQYQLLQDICARNKFAMLDLPANIFTPRGFLKNKFIGKDPSHGNQAYGRQIINYLAEYASARVPAGKAASRRQSADSRSPVDEGESGKGQATHPYADLPDYQFWKQAVSQVPANLFDPVARVPFKITPRDKVATAGSCFAQHISKKIRASGFNFYVTEKPAELSVEAATEKGFYDFSARYGNIYTARQLVQLFDRAFGHFHPRETAWRVAEETFCDPFRPRVEPGGYPSLEKLEEDRRNHLAAVREMFENVDVFVFTLGLTECWGCRADGAVYPVAPGVVGGEFDPEKHQFLNFTADEVIADLSLFVEKLRDINPGVRIILTVSPVPLVATYENRHVLVSTTYSKSVLRVAAEMICEKFPQICYFPSYEIITGNFNRGAYFGNDLRGVKQVGVDHVMRVFMKHMADREEAAAGETAELAPGSLEDDEMDELSEAACDEEMLERE